jgi:ribosomal protein S7
MRNYLFNKEQTQFIFLFCLKVLIKKGSKAKSLKVLNNFATLLKKNTEQNLFSVILKSVKNVEPFCEVKNLKVGAVIRRVPVAVYSKKQKYIAIKCLIANAKKQNEKIFTKKLTTEFEAALLFSGKSVKNCIDFHKIAEINKIFTLYRN